MKVAVVGSRSIGEADISRFIPPDADLIISGGAVGVDTLAEKYADERGIKKLKVVWSEEEPIPSRLDGLEEELPEGRRALPGSVAFVPSVAGLIIAGEVIKDLTK